MIYLKYSQGHFGKLKKFPKGVKMIRKMRKIYMHVCMGFAHLIRTPDPRTLASRRAPRWISQQCIYFFQCTIERNKWGPQELV